ncbi:MAG: glycosyltransferase family 39 protein [Sphingomonas bacterium]
MLIKPFPARVAAERVVLAIILIVALGLRMRGVAFGLPGLYDPDEPIFMLCALKLLRDHTLNPGWFGHPGSTTIYVMAIVEASTFLIGHWLGYFPTQAAFIESIYRDPGIVFLPGRLFIVACSVGCVAFTYLIARRLCGAGTALLAAGILAVDALHIQWSQVIRTDVHASLFMLASLWFAIGIAQRGRLLEYLGAGAMAGLACATKWPAATIIAATIGAATLAMMKDRVSSGRHVRMLGMALVAMVLATIAASPYLLLDYPTVAANLGGDGQAHHLGATGGTFFENMVWYVAHPLRDTLGVTGLAMLLVGIVAVLRQARLSVATLLLPAIVFFVAIASQHLIWARWIVPIMPMIAILVAIGMGCIVAWLRAHIPPAPVIMLTMALAAILLLPMLRATQSAAAERANDTRVIAVRWITANVARDETIAVEHFAFNLSQAGYRIIFPAGQAGCVDAMALLNRRVSYAQTGRIRGNVGLADFGTVPTAVQSTCRAGVVMVTDLDRYLAESETYPSEIAAYRRILAGGRLVAIVRPIIGRVGGPAVRIYRLPLR